MNEIMMLIVFGVACLFAVVGMFAITARRPHYKAPRVRRVKLTEFSKRMVVALCVMWFVGALIGMFVVAAPTVRYLPELLHNMAEVVK